MGEAAEKFIGPQGLREVASDEERLDVIDLEFARNVIQTWNDRRPKLDDFSDVHDRSQIQEDKKAVIEKKAGFHGSKRQDAIGALGEYMALQGYYEEVWLPAVEDVIRTSEWDDSFKGTDMVFRFESEDDDSLYLGVDVKTTRDHSRIWQKISGLKEAMRRGLSTNLRYFHDEDMDRKGEQAVPSLIIVVDPRFAISMQEIMAKTPKKRTAEENKKVELMKNVMSMEIIAQLMEMDLFFDTEGLKSRKHNELQGKYQNIIKSINRNMNLDDLASYIADLVNMTEDMGPDYHDLNVMYKKYLITIDDYKTIRDI